MLKKSLLIIFLVLLFDQILKIWVKTHMCLGQEYHVFGNWSIIHFTENNGMAFGMEFAGNYGKLFLTVFRMLASVVLGWYLFKLTQKKDVPLGLIICFSLIFAGAVGNIIDSAFYGLIFNDSMFQVTNIFPSGGGYAGFLHGKVVDMLYFPILHGHFPQWLPFWGGEDFEFFRPVFNLSDSSITVGVLSLIIFQRKFYNSTLPKEDNEVIDETTDSSIV
jgi:signal peptidase II